jgi:hypothetical protein
MDTDSTRGVKVRPSTIEGIFYPAEKNALSLRLRQLLDHIDRRMDQERTLYSIIVPHAALDYCGQIAAPAYGAAVGRSIRTVVLLGPVHREHVEAVILPQSQVFQTPLGSIPVDEADVQKLAKLSPSFKVDDIPHLEEHCLEAQLPFVQHLFPDARIVPILLGKATRTLAERLSDSLLDVYSGRIASTLFIVTANLSSNLPEGKARKEADRIISWIGTGDWQALIEAAESKRISSCGAGCVAVILLMNGKLRGTISVLEQGSSLQVVKDPKKVVCYASFALSTDRDRINGVSNNS